MASYIGIFLIALSSLTLEIALVRLLSVITWYHLAFFSISTAMLGMTAGATSVYLRPDEFSPGRALERLPRNCLMYAAVIPVSLIVLCLLPLGVYRNIMSPIGFLIATMACSVPFYFSGIVVTVLLTRSTLPVGTLYASDLIGASLGCIVVLFGLQVLDAPSLILSCSSTGALAGFFLARGVGRPRQASFLLVLTVLFVVASLLNAGSLLGIRPLFVKSRMEVPSKRYFLEAWNAFSRVVVYNKTTEPPQYWGPSPLAPEEPIEQHKMNIDGEAGTTMRRFETLDDIRHLRYDVTNVGYYLERPGPAYVIGVGAGKDVLAGILFGQSPITAVDVNPIFIDLLQDDLREFAGIADRDDVTLVVDDARSHLSRSSERYTVIQMSLIDTWASTGAGAFSLSENALYTLEAWGIFLERLADDGFFTVSRWHSPENIGETGRVLSLAVASLLELGVSDPGSHIALIGTDKVATLLVSRRPFTEEEITILDRVSDELRYETIHLPGQPPTHDLLRRILSVRSRDALQAAIADAPLNYAPPTDENPYFFNMLKLSGLKWLTSVRQKAGVIRGNLVATITLLILLFCLLLVSFVVVILPLAQRTIFETHAVRFSNQFWLGAAYFSLIGCGFMFFEIALIQRLSTFLGHPIYGLGVLLFTVIASTGVGSFLSERVPLERVRLLLVLAGATAFGILLGRFLVNVVATQMVAASMPVKIVTSVLIIFPFGILMGFFFPTGMRIVRTSEVEATPWYWALNGVFGVLCSALAVFFAIYTGIATNFYIAAICYVGASACLYGLFQTHGLWNPGTVGANREARSAEV